MSLAEQKAVQAELDTTLKQMKFMVINATLHARVEVVKEFKDGKLSEWDPDYEIGFWKDREAELAEVREESEATSKPLTPRAKSPKTTKRVRVDVIFKIPTKDQRGRPRML